VSSKAKTCPLKMSALRVIVIFENAELDVNILPEKELYRIAQRCNVLWETAETADVKYRTLLYEHGELYVYAGDFDECRCSEVEARLVDMLGELDWDDHHFNLRDLPEDVTEKTLLYQEDDGMLRIRKLVGDTHPLFEGMSVRFEIVITEDSILSELKFGEEKKCSSYAKYVWFHKTQHSTIPEEIWKYYDFDRMMLDLWRDGKIDIVYRDTGGKGFVRLEEMGLHFPVWMGKETDWFYGNPYKDSIYIVY
jgi:hypothetical protein